MNKVTEKNTMPTFICVLVNSSQNFFWDIILCVLQDNSMIEAVIYYHYSLSVFGEKEVQGD